MNTEEFKKIASKIKTEIDHAQTILLCCHPSADPDSVGSVLALMWYLESLGKKVIPIRGDDELQKGLLTLPGAKKIINNNFTEVDGSDFDLFIATDASAPQQVTKKADLSLGVLNKSVVIDHHGTDIGWGFVNCVIKDSPATAQIIYDLFEVWGVEITPKMAKCLFAGIYADTGGFKYSMTTAKTFSIASKLVEKAPDFSEVIFNLENSYDPGNIKYLGLALNLIEVYFSGKVAISSVPLVEMEKLGIKYVHTTKMQISNYLKSVIDWKIGACLLEKEDGSTGVSLRTRDAERWDVGKIAKALGGGGHSAAAGATINEPLMEARELFLSTVENLFPELGSR